MAAVVAPRRTQAERRASTRARLLDATVECLAELGYARTTTSEVARRAGLSRGAQLHHFPTKAELVATAVEHVFDRRVEDFRAAFARLPESADRAQVAVDVLWDMFRGPTFTAWVELVVAGRTELELGTRMSVVSQRLVDQVGDTFVELFPPTADAGPSYWVLPAFIFALLDGLALQRMAGYRDADRHNEQVLAFVKQLASLLGIGQTQDS